jgi:pimeloyl-ACP methyl ester carboxylesterase
VPRFHLAVLILAASLAACAKPVGVDRVDPQTAQRALTRNVLSSGEPSSFAKAQLLQRGLWNRYNEAPDETLDALRDQLGTGLDDRLLFALAELSFHQGQKTGNTAQFLASACYAYAFLFPESGEQAGAYDARTRLALDLYNRGVSRGFQSGPDETVEFREETFELPFGQLDVAIEPSGFEWSGYRFARFKDLYRFEVRGLRNRYRRPGIGAALGGSLDPPDRAAETPPALRVPERLTLPVTALLRIERPHESVITGQVRGTLRIFAEEREPSVRIGSRVVPLEYEPSAALAYTLDRSELWSFENKGFLSGDFQSELDGLYSLAPYGPGRIPVVLVHGTASSPARWAQMINELGNDPRLHSRYQFWLFLYNTGNPILYSASVLRRSLIDAVAQLDPEGVEPSLRDMVVIGHSQGGLLTRLMVTESGDRFWNPIFKKPLDQLEISPKTHSLLESAFFFEPVPSVTSVVFISTPHRGSFLAGRRLAALLGRMVSFPFRLAAVSGEVLTNNQDALAGRKLKRVATSVDNMDPKHPFSLTLSASPIAPGVDAHSIISVKGDGPPWSGKSDGVVAYDSAHMEGVASELVVRSGHSTQGEPATIEEVRRILLEHLEAR